MTSEWAVIDVKNKSCFFLYFLGNKNYLVLNNPYVLYVLGENTVN